MEDIVIELSENPHFDTVHKYGGEILVTSLVEKFLKLTVLSGYNEKKRFSASGQNAVAGAENAF